MVDHGKSWLGAIAGVLLALAIVVVMGLRRTEPPAPAAGTLLPEASGALGEVLLHYVPDLEPIVEPPYTDFLRALSPDVRVEIVAAKGYDRAKLDAFLGRIGRSASIIETEGPITTWSKDRALVAKLGEKITLIGPAEPSRSWAQRHNDWQTLRSVAGASSGRVAATYLPLDFDAGDFMVDDGRIIVDCNLVTKNQHRGVSGIGELRRRLGTLLRMPVLVLGDAPNDTPRHHLAMYMTTLVDRVALVGDPVRARAIVGDAFEPGDPSGDTGEMLRADFSDEMTARFERAARDLAAAGYRVERIPNVPFDDKTYISYTNGVFETRGGRRIAYMPVYGVTALDAAAREIYERLGWEVVPIRVRSVYPHHGTIGCLVNVIDRG